MFKLLPRGPVQLVASATSPLATVSTVGDWAAGRSLEQEEKRLGILCRVRSLAAPQPQVEHTTSSKKALVAASRVVRPLPCVIKCDVNDWQVNELDPDGSAVFLQKRPKPRWKKKEQRQTYLVEDNSDEQFTDPSKTFTPRVMNQGAYARDLGRMSAERPLLAFTVYRENTSVDAMKERLQKEARVDPANLELSDGTSTHSFGCITQRGLGIGITPDALLHGSRHYSLHSLLFDPDARMYSVDQLPELRRAPAGTLFRVLLRCVDASNEDEIDAVLKHLSTVGFVNYFDVSRFGIGGSSLHEIAVSLHQGDLQRACAMWLQGEAEKNSVHFTNFLSYLKAEPSTTQGVVSVWRKNALRYNSNKRMLSFLEQLESLSENSSADTTVNAKSAALENLARAAFPSHDVYFNSAAEFLWNAMASQRLITYGLRVVVGDVVYDAASSSYCHISSTELAAKYSIQDVVLPVLYTSSPSTAPEVGRCRNASSIFPTHSAGEEFCKDFCELHKIGFLLSPGADGDQQRAREHWQMRHIVVRPKNLRYAAVLDPNSFCAVKSDLFLLQERLAPRAIGDLQQRLREPCVFNVSEAFVEKMKPILAARKGSPMFTGAKGRYSVLISCVMPQGSHMNAALREVFDVSHATFHDLLR